MRRYLPEPTLVSQPFWDGCRERELRLQQCGSCKRHIFYPGYVCHHCGSADLAWTRAGGGGSVFSCTVAEHDAASGGGIYVLALIQLDEGPIMMSNVRTDAPYGVRIGDRVRVAFEEASDEITLPVFEPDGTGA